MKPVSMFYCYFCNSLSYFIIFFPPHSAENIICSLFLSELKLDFKDDDDYGRLKIFHQGEWGTVCNDKFDDVAATVACKQMGHQRGIAYEGNKEYKYPSTFHGSQTSDPTTKAGPIWLDDVSCLGDEHKLAECDHSGWLINDCSHKEDVWIKCFDQD